MTLGEKISYLRTESKMSQENLAEKLSVSRQSVSKWERGDSVPGIERIIALANLFCIGVDALISEDYRTIKKCRVAMTNYKSERENKYFGTDGFRGEAGVTLTSEQAYRIGRFLGWYFSSGKKDGTRARIAVGKDTRRSSYMLEYSIIAGITASGADVYMLHVITTPGVSYVTKGDGFDCGIMITASHNPYYDNGIKLISSDGEKIGDGITAMIEAYLDGDLSELGISGSDLPYAVGENIGGITDYTTGRNRYIGYLISLASHSFRGLRIGLDLANGASWLIARNVFEALGAELYVTGCEPNGVNINKGVGSTCIDNLVSLVKAQGLDLGFAFDGDGDRCIAVDSVGQVIDGDGILYILARRLKTKASLEGNRIAVTVMSNSGLLEALREMDIGYEITPVGDRFVYDRMQKLGLALGGETSGHVIIRKYATTGDGLLTALMLTEEILDRRESLSELTRYLNIYPQLTENLRVSDRDAVINDKRIIEAANRIRSELGDKGKLLIRKSGTEPLIRITLECEDKAKCSEYLGELTKIIDERGYRKND